MHFLLNTLPPNPTIMAHGVNRFSSPSSPSLHHFCFLSKNTMQINHSLALKQGMMERVKAYTTSSSIACLDSLQNESKDYFSLYKMLFECSQLMHSPSAGSNWSHGYFDEGSTWLYLPSHRTVVWGSSDPRDWPNLWARGHRRMVWSGKQNMPCNGKNFSMCSTVPLTTSILKYVIDSQYNFRFESCKMILDEEISLLFFVFLTPDLFNWFHVFMVEKRANLIIKYNHLLWFFKFLLMIIINTKNYIIGKCNLSIS